MSESKDLDRLCDKQMKRMSSEFDEGLVGAGSWPAASGDAIAPFERHQTVWNAPAVMLWKHHCLFGQFMHIGISETIRKGYFW